MLKKCAMQQVVSAGSTGCENNKLYNGFIVFYKTLEPPYRIFVKQFKESYLWYQ